jgi:uncharacterized protein
MIINLAELRQKNQPTLVRADFSEEQLGVRSLIMTLEKPVHADLKVAISGDRVIIAGRLEALLRLTCCRCAETFLVEVGKAFESVYVPDPEVGREGEEIELAYDDLDFGFYRDELIDLTAVLSEQIVLEIPMKPMCSDSCKGLCSICGADLNKRTCDCKRETTDPRLAPLAELKRKFLN